MSDHKPRLIGGLARLTTVNNIDKEIEYMTRIRLPCVYFHSLSATQVDTVIST